MKTTDEILELLRQFKSVAGEKYGIEQLALFGSAARGDTVVWHFTASTASSKPKWKIYTI